MGVFTINSAKLVNPPAFDPLIINLEVKPGGVINAKAIIRLIDGKNSGANVQTYALPPTITIIQPMVWNEANFTPDQITLNSVTLNLGTGASGILYFKESDDTTDVVLPVTIPLVSSGSSIQYYIGYDGFTNGSTDSSIVLNVTATDTVTSQSVTEDVVINAVNT